MNLLLALILLVCLSTGSALQCYECNVWKAGYGHLCSNPRLRDDCTVCIKIETNIWVGYYKSTPRQSTIFTKICSKSRTIHFSNECHTYTMADGKSTRCYCDTDKCNSAPRSLQASLWLPVIASMVLLVKQRLLA